MAAWLQIAATAATWVGLFDLNTWLFDALDMGHVVNWVFLPAAIRMLAVMGLGRRGAAGLWLGNLVTSAAVFAMAPLHWLTVSTLSAGGPLVAVYLVMRLLRVPMSLQGLTPGQLAVFAVAGALCNAIPHNIFFWAVGLVNSPFERLVPMFVGDLLGTFLVLYTLRMAIRMAHRFVKFPTT